MYREEQQRRVEQIYRTAFRIISVIYIIGIVSLVLSFLSTPIDGIVTLIYKILFFPFLFQLDDRTPSIFGGLILVIIFFIMQFIFEMTRNLLSKKLMDYYLLLPMIFNLGISIWYIGSSIESDIWWGELLIWLSYAVKGFIILVIVPAFCYGLINEGERVPKDDLKLENKVSKSHVNYINKYRYMNPIMGN